MEIPLPATESMSEDNIITIQCEYTLADLHEGIRRAHRRNIKNFWPFWLILAVVWATLIGWTLLPSPSASAPAATQPANLFSDLFVPLLPWIGVFVAIMVASRWGRRRVAARQFSRFGPLQRPRTFQLSTSGVTVTEPLSYHHYQWQAFPRWEETKNLFTLYISEYGMEIITKRAVGSETTIEQLRDMLRSSIDPAKTARQAFPVLPPARQVDQPV